MLVRSFQASSTYLRKLASSFGAGSVATTSNPRARYSAAQLAPMTPVPTMAMRRIGLLYDMIFLRLFGLKFNGSATGHLLQLFRIAGSFHRDLCSRAVDLPQIGGC